MKDCQHYEVPPSSFLPASGTYDVRRRHHAEVFRFKLSLTFTKTPQGWSMMGQEQDGAFTISEGLLAHNGSIMWVEEGPTIYHWFGMIPGKRRTLSRGDFKLGSNDMGKAFWSSSDGRSGAYEWFHLVHEPRRRPTPTPHADNSTPLMSQ